MPFEIIKKILIRESLAESFKPIVFQFDLMKRDERLLKPMTSRFPMKSLMKSIMKRDRHFLKVLQSLLTNDSSAEVLDEKFKEKIIFVSSLKFFSEKFFLYKALSFGFSSF